MVFFNIDEPSISVQETEKKVDQGCAGYQARSTVTGAQAKKGRDLERSIGSTPPTVPRIKSGERTLQTTK